jgi:hypothetical protein
LRLFDEPFASGDVDPSFSRLREKVASGSETDEGTTLLHLLPQAGAEYEMREDSIAQLDRAAAF